MTIPFPILKGKAVIRDNPEPPIAVSAGGDLYVVCEDPSQVTLDEAFAFNTPVDWLQVGGQPVTFVDNLVLNPTVNLPVPLESIITLRVVARFDYSVFDEMFILPSPVEFLRSRKVTNQGYPQNLNFLVEEIGSQAQVPGFPGVNTVTKLLPPPVGSVYLGFPLPPSSDQISSYLVQQNSGTGWSDFLTIDSPPYQFLAVIGNWYRVESILDFGYNRVTSKRSQFSLSFQASDSDFVSLAAGEGFTPVVSDEGVSTFESFDFGTLVTLKSQTEDSRFRVVTQVQDSTVESYVFNTITSSKSELEDSRDRLISEFTDSTVESYEFNSIGTIIN